MFKLMLWPIIIVVLCLLIVVVFSRKGNAVASLASDIRLGSTHYWVWLAISIAGCVISGFVLESCDSLFVAIGTITMSVIVLLVSVVGLLAHFLADLFRASAPVASRIGEELTEDQRRSLLRHGFRLFNKFKNW